jgi:excisionase family DNA binding protein
VNRSGTRCRISVTHTQIAYAICDVVAVKSLNCTDRVAECATDDLLVKRELAAKLKRSVRTVDAWMRQGKLPYLKVGKTVLFRWEDVLQKLSTFRIN